MSAIRTSRKKQPRPPIAFTLAESGADSKEFIAGECICRNCKSLSLKFSNYIEDAKCDDCGQWQNEELILQ